MSTLETTGQGAGKETCGAQRMNQAPGVTCQRPAGAGTSHPGVGHCSRHCGSTPNGERAAQAEIARRAVLKFALAPEEEIPSLDPREVLAEELHRSHCVVLGLDRRINELAEIHGPTFHATGKRTGEAKPHVEWVMWQEARSHLKSIAVECHRAGIEVFYATLADRQAELVAEVLRASLRELGVSAEDARVREVVARQLRLLPGGKAA